MYVFASIRHSLLSAVLSLCALRLGPGPYLSSHVIRTPFGWGLEDYHQVWCRDIKVEIWADFLFGGFAVNFDWLLWRMLWKIQIS